MREAAAGRKMNLCITRYVYKAFSPEMLEFWKSMGVSIV